MRNTTTPHLCTMAAQALRRYANGDLREALAFGEASQEEYDDVLALADRLESATSLDEAHADLCEAWEIADGL